MLYKHLSFVFVPLLTVGLFSNGVSPIRSEVPPTHNRGVAREITLSGQTLREFKSIRRLQGELQNMKDGEFGGHPVRFRADRVVVKLRNENSFSLHAVEDGKSVTETIESLKSNADVEYAEPDYEAKAFYIPNDTYYSYQWNFDNAVNGGVGAEEAWDIASGTGVTVAVIDTGVAYENYGIYKKAPDFVGTIFVSGYDFVNNDSHPNDDEGHGTHVAGTVAQTTGNGGGVAGLAYGAGIMPIKVLDSRGSGSYSDVALGILFAADNGAKVINLSLGGPTGASYLEEALAYAYARGVTIVAATGNDSRGSLSFPAAYNQYVIAVGAIRYDQTRASYSNYGPGLDIVAPGGDLGVDQNGDGYGDGILQQTFSGSPSNFGYYFYSGTSMATPHVAAAAALVISKGQTQTPDGVRDALQSSADDLGSAGYDEVYGSGRLNASAALGFVPGPTDNPPTVSITSPANGATVSGILTISATASDDNGVSQVEFFADNVSIGVDGAAPYELPWDTSAVADGVHAIKATATDTASQTASASVNVTADNIVETTVFSDSFEVSEWNGLWTEDVGNRWFRTTNRKTEGSYSADVRGNSSNNALTGNAINLGGRTNARITFSWFIESSLDTGEYIAFDVSTDGGASFVEKVRLRGNVDPENKWHSVSLELSGLSALKLRFRGTMNSTSEDANVDNVKVVAW